ncbi:MAG: glucose-6-phosphate isomerase [Clostridia bacterium]|nr:glucose-6-phosphate isomerase [Clostridia bacterium]
MQAIGLNEEYLKGYVEDYELEMMKEKVMEAADMLKRGTGAGRDMLGWVDLPNKISEEEVQHIKECADRIGKQADVFIVIGIGGSYLGAKAVIDMLGSTFSNLQSLSARKHPQIIFAGNNLSGKYLRDLVEYVKDKDFAINVISKSGRTLEPAIAFRVFRLILEEKYGITGAASRIYVTTDEQDGLLCEIARKNEYEKFVIPKDVGGRYSVLTPVGLLPMAVAGIDFEDVIDGAIFAEFVYNDENFETNSCYRYAAYRNILEAKGKDIEVMACYEPSCAMFIEWFKQLFGESEGKDGKGIFPAGVNLTTDLHSMGQMLQEGKRNIFETVLSFRVDKSLISLPEVEKNEDELNYLAGKDIDYINKQAFLGTVEAHFSGGVPTMIIDVEELSPYNVGELIYFFEKACAISAYVSGVNPFNQPGVEAYKKNMMRLLKEGKNE